MKKYLFMLMALALFSCDDMGDYLNSLETEFVFDIVGQDDANTFYDTLKYVEVCNNCERIDYFISKPFDVKRINCNISLGGGEIRQNDISVQDLDPKLTQFYYKPNAIGTHIISVTVTDINDETYTSNINLHVFDNLSPVAILNLNKLQEDNALEYEFNANESYDMDEKYGGFLLGYEYKVVMPQSTQEFSTTKEKVNFAFPGPGLYEINLTVVDSDSVRSEVLKKTLEIE